MNHADSKDLGGFFTQDDWEFELDQMSPDDTVALREHLLKAPAGHPTAAFLQAHLDAKPRFAFFDGVERELASLQKSVA